MLHVSFSYQVPAVNLDENRTISLPVYLRERKTSASFSPSNLFGQPFLIAVPKQATYQQLYELILSRLSRYVTKADPDQDWWKSKANGQPKETTHEAEQTDASSLEQSSPEMENDVMIEDDNGKGPPYLFEMNIVNSYGNAQLDPLENDGMPLKLSGT